MIKAPSIAVSLRLHHAVIGVEVDVQIGIIHRLQRPVAYIVNIIALGDPFLRRSRKPAVVERIKRIANQGIDTAAKDRAGERDRAGENQNNPDLDLPAGQRDHFHVCTPPAFNR